MDPARRTLSSLVSTSQHIHTIATQYANSKDVSQVRGHSLIRLEMELQSIAAACRAVLEMLDGPILSRQYMLDDRLIDWLSGTEPKACLATLHEMKDLLKVDRGVQPFNGPTEFSCPKEEVFEAVVTLFHSRKAYFHFLLRPGDIWNYETGLEQDMPMDVGSGETAGKVTQSERQSIATNYMMSEEENRRKHEVIFEKLEKFLRFLDALDCTTKQKETSSLRQLDTCTWLFSTAQYKSWRDGNNSFLLLHGKAGAGKTVLTSSVVQDLLETTHEGEFLAYFYCDFRTGRSTSAVEVMRSIVAQLVASLCAVMVEPEDLLDYLLKETNNRADLFYNVKGLSRHLSKIAKLCPRKPLIVIDALDECREVETLLDGLIMANGDVRTFVTSRPHQNIIAMLSHLPSISMDRMANELSADILLHVTNELDSRCRLRTFGKNLKAEMRSKLCAKADGMFRWVQCQIDTLDKCTSVSEIRRVLESLPDGLEETYRRILIAIDRRPYEARRVRRALVWLVTTLRPMQMAELLEAVMIDSDYQALDSRFKLMRGADLLEVCRSLVVHREETDVITLSHMSVKEYLVGELIIGELRWYHIVMEDAHERLARLCMAYIAICLEQISDRSSSVIQEPHVTLATLQESHPLLEYVLSYGFSHLSHLGPENSGIFKDIEGLQVRIHRHNWEWDRLCRFVPLVRSGIPWPTSEHDVPLYILVTFGSDALFRTFVRFATLTPREGTNPLIYAAYFGKIEHARILISWGVDVNLRGFILNAMITDYSDADTADVDKSDEDGSNSDNSDVGDTMDHKAIPLEVAVDHWQAEIVDLLLAHSCIVPARLLARVLGEQPHKFPLYIINRLLQRSEFAKWSISPWENRGLLDVLISDAEDHGQVGSRNEVALALRKLVEAGCAETLLLVAVEKGCISVVEDLLSMDTSSTSNPSLVSHTHAIMGALAANGDTPLHLALQLLDENCCLLITKLLVEAGFGPSELDADDKPPVHIAVMRGFISVVEYLLSQDVPLPSRILFAALQAPPPKRVEMIRLLTSKGPNVHTLSPSGNSLLHLATGSLDRSVGMEITQILIDAGCIPPALNLGDKTLSIVTEQEYREVGSYLLLFGTSLDIFSLLDPDPSTQAVALHSLISNVHGLQLRPEAEDRLLQVVSQCLDDEDQYLILVKKFLAAWGDLCLGGTNLFIRTVRRGFRRVIEYLDSRRVPIPRTILFTALRHQVSMVPFLIRKGADLHAKENNGDTILHVAMSTLEEAQCHMTAQALIDAGYHIFTANDAGQFPIDVGVSRGFTSVVEYLLSQRIPLPQGVLFTALRHQASMVPFLPSKGADVHVQRNGGDTLLHVAMLISEESRCYMVAQALVQAGCPTSTSNAAGMRPIHVAVSRGFISVVEYLLSVAPHDTLPSDLLSSVSLRHNSSSMVCFLVGHGADVAHIDLTGNGPLHHVMQFSGEYECLEATRVLIDAGCRHFAPNTSQETPLHTAITRRFASVALYLVSKDMPLPPDILSHALRLWPMYEVEHHRWKLMVTSFICKGASVHARETNGDTMIHHALRLRSEALCLKVTQLLVGSGCSISLPNADGELPIQIAVTMTMVLVVEYLISQNVPLPRDILLAAMKAPCSFIRALQMISLLAHNGADVSVCATNSDSVLHVVLLAAQERCWPPCHELLEVVTILVQGGCDPRARNSKGRTPLEVAVSMRYSEIEDYLRSRRGSDRYPWLWRPTWWS